MFPLNEHHPSQAEEHPLPSGPSALPESVSAEAGIHPPEGQCTPSHEVAPSAEAAPREPSVAEQEPMGATVPLGEEKNGSPSLASSLETVGAQAEESSVGPEAAAPGKGGVSEEVSLGTASEAGEVGSAPGEPQASEKPPKSQNMEWYILKVQSNREESIREGLLRRAAIAGLDHCFGEIIIPTEKVTEFKGGKKRITSRKLYPGYLVIQMELNDETWFLVRETPGIGDFAGAIGRPSPLPPYEVNRILAKKEEKTDETPKLKIGFQMGDRVKITEGTFENFEGEVSFIDDTNGRVTVMINIFNRTTPVEFEYWQLEKV